jgi:hypothetical protein
VTSPYFPKDFDIEKPPHDGYAQAPRSVKKCYNLYYLTETRKQHTRTT